MDKPIRVRLLTEAEEYIDNLELAAQKKFVQAFRKTASGYSGKWFTKLVNTDDIYEFRVHMKRNAYRVFAFWDTEGETETLIICTHGLDKKTQKTPKSSIEKAEQFKRKYFGE
jgi:phage-related protein